MRKETVIFLMIGLLLCQTQARSQELWSAKDGSVRSADSRALVADRSYLYLATRNEVYTSSGDGGKWISVFSLPSGENEINCLAGKGNNIFAGTRRGLFRSQDHGKSWRNVFKTIIPEKSSIFSAELSRQDPEYIVIGTGRGVFTSEDGGTRWQDTGGILKNGRIMSVAMNKGSIYACAEEGVFLKVMGASNWERIYMQSSGGGETPEELPDNAEVEEEGAVGITCIAFRGSRLYIGGGRKILFSDNNGKLWSAFSRSGLSGAINCVLPSAKTDRLYCATTKGAFVFDPEKKRWLELYVGVGKMFDVKSMIFGSEDESSIWAVTNKGLYRLEAGGFAQDQYIDVERNIKQLKIVFDGEPSFRQLQQAAMKFAEVDPEKIRQWRSQARLKALVPKISLGIDNNRSNNYEIYTSATRDYVATGPDDISEGFDVSVSWELGDMIWSDDQTNIDVRSRLTTQLRNDILDDLRRAYYERKRLQFEIMASPPKDIKARFEKELRIQELTQAIDDLTGNYLTEHIKSSVK